MNFLKIEVFSEAAADKFNDDICDGCGKRYRVGEKRLSGIASHYSKKNAKNLCKVCIKWAYKKLYEE